MISNIIDSATSFLKDGVKGILGSFFGDKISEKDSKELDLKIQELMIKANQLFFGGFADLTEWGKNLRSSVRPILTYWGAALITIYAVVLGPMVLLGWITLDDIKLLSDLWNSIPDRLWTIFMIMFGFWFGGRAIVDIRRKMK